MKTSVTVRIGCDLLVLNSAFRNGDYSKSSVPLQMSIALQSLIKGHRMTARRYANQYDGCYISPQGYYTGSFFWTCTGDWKNALAWTEKGILLSKTLGDYRNWRLISGELVFIRLWQGNIFEVMRLEEDRV